MPFVYIGLNPIFSCSYVCINLFTNLKPLLFPLICSSLNKHCKYFSLFKTSIFLCCCTPLQDILFFVPQTKYDLLHSATIPSPSNSILNSPGFRLSYEAFALESLNFLET